MEHEIIVRKYSFRNFYLFYKSLFCLSVVIFVTKLSLSIKQYLPCPLNNIFPVHKNLNHEQGITNNKNVSSINSRKQVLLYLSNLLHFSF